MATAKLSVELEALTSKYVADLNRAADKLRDFSDKATRAGTALTAAFTVPLALLARTAINSGAELDGLNRSMVAIEGSAEGASKRIKILNEIAKLPGLNFKDAVQGDVNLRSAGLSAELAAKSMSAFGNALGILGKSGALGNVNTQIQQMANKTQGFGVDLKILKEWVPQVGLALQNAFGTQSADAISQMGVTGKEVIEKIVLELEKLPKATGGIGNALENMQDSWFKFTGNMGLAIDKAVDLTGIFDKISAKLTEVAEAFKNADAGTQKLIIGFGAFMFAAGPVMLFMVKFGALIIPVTAAVVALGGAFIVAGGHMEAFRKIQADLFDSMADKVSKLVDKLGNMFRIFVKIKEIQLGKVLGLNTIDAERDLIDLKGKGAGPFKFEFPKANQSLGDLRKEIEEADKLRRLQNSKGGPTGKAGKGDKGKDVNYYQDYLAEVATAERASIMDKVKEDDKNFFDLLSELKAKDIAKSKDWYKNIKADLMGMAGILEQAKPMGTQVEGFMLRMKKQIAETSKDLSKDPKAKKEGETPIKDMFQRGAGDIASGLASWAGAWAAGMEPIRSFAQELADLVGNMLSNLGQALMMQGLKTGNWGLAGIGALASIAGSFTSAKSQPRSATRSNVPSYQPIYTPYTNTGSNNGARISVELMGSNSIRGNDIHTSYNQTIYDRSRG